jgi:ATP-dependent exoDNAse (exonuclease V) beta subunit
MDLNIFHLRFARILGEIDSELSKLLNPTSLPELESFDHQELEKTLLRWERQLRLLDQQMTRATTSARNALQLEQASAPSFARIDRYRAIQSIESRKDNLQALERESEIVRDRLNELTNRLKNPTRAEKVARFVTQADDLAEKADEARTAIGEIPAQAPLIRSIETPHADLFLLTTIILRALTLAALALARRKRGGKSKGIYLY